MSFTSDQLVENVISATEQVAGKMAADNIQSVHVKTLDSIALPILNCLPPGPTVIDITSQPAVTSKRSRADDEIASGVDGSAETEETMPVKKKVKKTKVSTKLVKKRVRGSIVVKKSFHRRQKR